MAVSGRIKNQEPSQQATRGEGVDRVWYVLTTYKWRGNRLSFAVTAQDIRGYRVIYTRLPRHLYAATAFKARLPRKLTLLPRDLYAVTA